MNKEIAAIVFSDLHIHKWAKFSTRLDTSLDILNKLINISTDNNVPLLFCGDLLHEPNKIEQDLLITLSRVLKELNNKGVKMYGISGNHTLKYTNSIDNHSISWDMWISENFSFFKLIDFSRVHIKNLYIHGIPYIDHNIGLNEYIKNIDTEIGKPRSKHILLLHTDYPGAKDTDGIEVNSVENLNINLLDKFDLVLIGHIHKPQRLSKKVYMVGAPYQQRRTDSNCELGYWELYSDMSMKFIPLKGYPKFIDVESEEDIKDDGNYYTIISKPKHIEDKPIKRITTDLSPKRLVKRYLKSKGEFTKDKKDILLQLIKDSSDDRI